MTRHLFPALDGDFTFLENAGGSQVPASVADAMRRHLLEDCCQLGAGYPASDRATATVDRAHRFMDRFVNGEGLGRVVLGASSTGLLHTLAHAWAPTIEPGDEVVVCEQGHEANIGCWVALERAGATIRWWRVDPETGSLSLDDLAGLLSSRTRIVAFPHVSNLLGEIVDVEAATRLVHEAGGKVVVDGVALAPHRAIDVAAWGCDWYVWSTYKVYGPHMGGLFGRFDAFAELKGPNHYFIPENDLPYKFELGGASHEGCAGLNGLAPLLGTLAGRSDAESLDADDCDRPTIERAFEAMTRMEAPLQSTLLQGLAGMPGVRVIGPTGDAVEERVATVAFVHETIDPTAFVTAAREAGVGIRNGHMYAYRLCEAMGIPPEPGVVRISAVHYNTPTEIERCLDSMEDRIRRTV